VPGRTANNGGLAYGSARDVGVNGLAPAL